MTVFGCLQEVSLSYGCVVCVIVFCVQSVDMFLSLFFRITKFFEKPSPGVTESRNASVVSLSAVGGSG